MGKFASSFVVRGFAFIGVITALSVMSSGCNEPDSFTSLGPVTAPSPTSTLGNTNYVLQTFQPALAVRGAECLLCHAKVSSSIITDFGYGDPQFFANQQGHDIWPDNGDVTNENPLTLPWYGDYFGSWQLAQITGTIVVPNAMVSDSRTLAAIGQSSPISLAELVDFNTGGSSFYDPSDAPGTGDAPFVGAGAIDSTVTPLPGNPKIAQIDEMYIGAPTEDQVSGLTSAPGSTTVGFEPIAGSAISGLSVQAGTGGSYVTNTGVLNCTGDIVVTGTLFLNNVTVNTDNNGCRLLVTQSVFLQGQVNYTSTAGTENLQISSARGIMMGFAVTGNLVSEGTTYPVSSLVYRLSYAGKYPDAQPLTRYPGTNTEKNAAIIAEANVIGSKLHDAADPAYCTQTMFTAQDGSSITQDLRCSINFQRLLLNAPDIESRYIGQFTGVVIAEIALFAPGALNFVYDSTFDNVPILPLLPPMLNIPGIGAPAPGCSGPLCGGGVIGI